jgi:hypothetical protein
MTMPQIRATPWRRRGERVAESPSARWRFIRELVGLDILHAAHELRQAEIKVGMPGGASVDASLVGAIRLATQ